MKKSASKEAVIPAKPYSAVTVKTGPLAGMVFEPEDWTPVEKGKVKVKYVAPDKGPRAVIEHCQVRGEFREADRAEDVRLGFAKLLPANILWSAENGYSDRASGTLLAWDHQLARFVVLPKEPEQIVQPEEDGAE
jgi:hypothetical protein